MICGGLSVVRERRSMWGLSLEKKKCVCVYSELSSAMNVQKPEVHIGIFLY